MNRKNIGQGNLCKTFRSSQFSKKYSRDNTWIRQYNSALSKDNDDSPEDLVSNQYYGKEGLKPICEKLISVVKKFGKDVVITPKKGSVSLIRKKQFALIKPATKTRIDLGLKLKGMEVTRRQENSGPFGTMCTHRVRLQSEVEIDDELVNWLSCAYNGAN